MKRHGLGNRQDQVHHQGTVQEDAFAFRLGAGSLPVGQGGRVAEVDADLFRRRQGAPFAYAPTGPIGRARI